MTVLNFQRSQVAIAWMSTSDWVEQFIVDFEYAQAIVTFRTGTSL